MLTKVVGIRRLQYDTVRKDGSPNSVDGYSFSLEYKDRDTIGVAVESRYVSKNALNNFGIAIPDDKVADCVGKTLEIEYNQRGYPMAMQFSEMVQK